MDILVTIMVNAFFYVFCGACIGGLVGWSLTYLWCHPEPKESYVPSDPRTWAELQVNTQAGHERRVGDG